MEYAFCHFFDTQKSKSEVRNCVLCVRVAPPLTARHCSLLPPPPYGTRWQRRAFRIMGILPVAATRFKLLSVAQHIEQICVNIACRIVSDANHPITLKLTPSTSNTRGSAAFPFVLNKANSTAYQVSFLQKYLHVLRDGAPNLYVPRSIRTFLNIAKVDAPRTARPPSSPPKPKQLPAIPKSAKPTLPCPNCSREYEAKTGLRVHRITCDRKTALALLQSSSTAAAASSSLA